MPVSPTTIASAFPSPVTSAKSMLPDFGAEYGPCVQSWTEPKLFPVLGRTLTVSSSTAIASALPSPVTSANQVPREPWYGPCVQSSAFWKPFPVHDAAVSVRVPTLIASALGSPLTFTKERPTSGKTNGGSVVSVLQYGALKYVP